MAIEQDAAKDLSLSDENAAMVAGGKKLKKQAHRSAPKAAAKTYPVGYINVPAATSTAPVDDSGTTASSADCDDNPSAC